MRRKLNPTGSATRRAMSLDSFPNIPRRADGAIDTEAYAAIATAERRGAMWQADAALRGG